MVQSLSLVFSLLAFPVHATLCSHETIRYYERIGLLPEPARSPGGFWLYRDDHSA